MTNKDRRRQMRIEFRVSGLPPKKDGATSMWNKKAEVPRLIKLRREALRSMKDDSLLHRNIRLHLRIHVARAEKNPVGDLDNFVTGVCDGLMKADGSAKLDQEWAATERGIHPSKPIAIVDDSALNFIQAEKTVGDTEESWYRVSLEGETS